MQYLNILESLLPLEDVSQVCLSSAVTKVLQQTAKPDL